MLSSLSATMEAGAKITEDLSDEQLADILRDSFRAGGEPIPSAAKRVCLALKARGVIMNCGDKNCKECPPITLEEDFHNKVMANFHAMKKERDDAIAKVELYEILMKGLREDLKLTRSQYNELADKIDKMYDAAVKLGFIK